MGIKPGYTGASEFTPCPAGQYSAVLVDVIDEGEKQATYAGKTKTVHKVRLVWQVDAAMESGERFSVHAWFNNSLGIYKGKRSNLLSILEQWRGVEYTEMELNQMQADGWELDSLIGKPCFLSVIHKTENGKTYANVGSIMKLPRQIPALAPTNYTRKASQVAASNGHSQPQQSSGHDPMDSEFDHAPVGDDDIPF